VVSGGALGIGRRIIFWLGLFGVVQAVVQGLIRNHDCDIIPATGDRLMAVFKFRGRN